MIGMLINLLVLFVVLAVVYYIVRLGAEHFGAPPVILQVTGLILGLILFLWVLQEFRVITGWMRIPP